MRRSALPAWLLAGLAACAPALQPPRPSVDPVVVEPPAAEVPPAPAVRVEPEPVAPVEVAKANGLMPLETTRAAEFARLFPDADGRGVLIGILDSGIDLGTPGLGMTSTGDPKVLDLRDFSGEGRVTLAPVVPAGDQVRVGGVTLAGFGRVRALNATGPWYGGLLAELALGAMPGSDLDGNGGNTDSLAVVVTRASDGWVLFADTDRDGSLLTERPLRDYLTGRETFGWRTGGRPAPVTLAVNLADGAPGQPPVLDLVFDQSSHGTHVAAIAAGRDMFGERGFDGVAPGAMLLGLKISNNAMGGISVTGSKLRAIDYAVRFARQRNLPLVLNLSFGVGNEAEGTARIDAIVDSVLAAHPDVVFVTSAGNDGPGLSTQGYPATARLPITVGATWPAAFRGDPEDGRDILAFFSARGGEMAKPDLVAPGFAYATVPRYNVGDEVKNGTSMASPHVAGLAARLLSARPAGRRPSALQVKQALMVTARPFEGASFVDQGTGLADLVAAHRWLDGNHPVEDVRVGVSGTSHSALWRGEGLRGSADTGARFVVRRPGGGPPATYRLRSSAPWLRAPATVTIGSSAEVPVSWSAADLREPGTHAAVISAWTADTAAGPAFRLVATIVVPEPGVAAPVRRTVSVASGAGRVFFQADSARPFEVRVSSTSPQRTFFGLFFEPGGQPWRGESFQPLGFGQAAAQFAVDGRDAQRGTWQVTVAPPVNGPGSAVVEVTHSPVRLGTLRRGDTLTVSVANLVPDTVAGEMFAGMVGGERGLVLTGRGGAPVRVPLPLPGWARRAVIDVTMPAADWPRFTDFGATLLDGAGQVVVNEPLNYHTARMTADLPEGPGGQGTLLFLPGFADPASTEAWELAVTVRFYAGDPVLLEAEDPAELRLAPGASMDRRFRLPAPPWDLPSGFAPLGQVALVVGERIWTREAALAAPAMAIRP